jgi:alpha-L-rhamnosidase
VSIRCTDLLTERLVEPVGLDTRQPRLSWRLDADAGETDVVQTGYRVEVEGRWDTGRVDGWRQQVIYLGPDLASGQPVRWRVRAWTGAGDTGWSPWSSFEPGILDPKEWAATMITAEIDAPVIRFARSIDIPDDVIRARLRVTGHGAVLATIGDTTVGDHVLDPGWTSYTHRLAVRTHDVTGLVRPGAADLAVLVAPGWFSGRLGWDGRSELYGRHRGAFAQLELLRAGGSMEVVGTDESWNATATPYLAADLYDGETYDARQPAAVREIPVSSVAGFDPAVLVAPPVPPVRRTEVLSPDHLENGIVDFGQNLVGRMRITIRDAPPGTEVVLRHAEVLGPDGELFTEPLRTARATDTYTCGGGSLEVYEPTFTFHGFRYAEITGIDPGRFDAEAVVIHSDLERIGTFSCSDPLLERLHENVVWGWRGNSVSIPTDCPQRDERLGWTGDAQVFAPTASFLYDCETFWENWLADLACDQLPTGSVTHVVPDILEGGHGAAGWGDAAVTVPWNTYVTYGDDTVLRRNLPVMVAWMDHVWSRLDDGLRWRQDFQFGDWLDPDAPPGEPWRAKARFDLVAGAYAARSARLVARAAAVVGDEGAARKALDRAVDLREAWWRHYGASAVDSQTGAALGLSFDLVPQEQRQAVADELRALVGDAGNHLATGFLGTPILLGSLTDAGYIDVAYDVLLQQTCPSWLYQVVAGATTIWERWDALRPDGSVPLDDLAGGSGNSMVSFNHYAYGAVADWLHSTVAGLRPDPDDPGYHHILVEPRPGGGITRAGATLLTRYGHAGVSWRYDGTELVVEVTVPPNASATVTLPDREPQHVGSGTYTFR